MIKFGKWIAKHRKLIVLLSVLLLIPSLIGISKTRINYDILSYLPNSLETVKGQDIMVDEIWNRGFLHGRRRRRQGKRRPEDQTQN